MTSRRGRGGASALASRRRMAGQSMAEFIIVIPVLLLLTLGILQFALFFMAKSTLDQAAISGVRAGTVENGNLCYVRAGIVKGLVPLYQLKGLPQQNIIGYAGDLAYAWGETTGATAGGLNQISIEVLNPPLQAFADFANLNNVFQDGRLFSAIPNARLLYRSTAPGLTSSETVQDANLLSIRVHYCFPVIVPIVRWVTELMTGNTSFDTACYEAGGVSIQADATMLMQSPIQPLELYGPSQLCTDPF